MPPSRSDPVETHVFTSHDLLVRFHTTPLDIDSGRAGVEAELRDLLPTRAQWRTAVQFVWNASETEPLDATLTVSDQRAASHLVSLLRRHRVIRTQPAEVRLPKTTTDTTADGKAEANAARLNFDQDLHEACQEILSADDSPFSISQIPSLADAVASHVAFLGAYTADGKANPLLAAVLAMKGVVSLQDLVQLVRNKSRYVRAAALLFARYALPPEDLGPLFGLISEPGLAGIPVASLASSSARTSLMDLPVFDGTVVQFDDEGSQGPFKQWARQLLLEDEVFELWLPTYAPCVLARLTQRLAVCDAPPQSAATKRSADGVVVAKPVADAAAGLRKPQSAVIAGFKSVAAMASYVKKAYELAKEGGSASTTNMGTATIAVRESDSVAFSAPRALAVPAAEALAAGVPQGVVAKTREEMMAQMRQRRVDRLRGGVNVSAMAKVADARKRGRAEQPAPSNGATAAAEFEHDDTATAELWPSEVVGPFNQHGALDDLFHSEAKMRLLYSTTVGPEDIELVF
jgi:hypothetical protein